MNKDEALRLALEALKEITLEHGMTEKARTAIKAALEAKDEPVAWMYEVNHAHTCLDLFEPPDDAYDEGTLYPLYTTPPQRKPLTDEEIGDEFVRFQVGGMFTPFLYAVRAIEAAHGIKGEA